MNKLVDELLSILLDNSADTKLRVQAVDALAEIALGGEEELMEKYRAMKAETRH